MDPKQVLQMLDQIMRSGKAVDAQLAMMREVNRAYELSLMPQATEVPELNVPMTAALCYPMVRYADLRSDGSLSGWRKTEVEGEPINYGFNPVVRVVKFVEER